MATLMNQGSSGSTFLFVLEKFESLQCEEDRGQVKQTQVLMVLALMEGQACLTQSPPAHRVT